MNEITVEPDNRLRNYYVLVRVMGRNHVILSVRVRAEVCPLGLSVDLTRYARTRTRWRLVRGQRMKCGVGEELRNLLRAVFVRVKYEFPVSLTQIPTGVGADRRNGRIENLFQNGFSPPPGPAGRRNDDFRIRNVCTGFVDFAESVNTKTWSTRPSNERPNSVRADTGGTIFVLNIIIYRLSFRYG